MAAKQINYTLLSQGEDIPPPLRKHVRKNRPVWLWALVGMVIITVTFTIAIYQIVIDEDDHFFTSNKPGCPQYPPLENPSDERRKLEAKVRDELDSAAFFDKSLKKLQGAIQIPTESYDDMGKVGEDSRWDIFAEFHVYLKEAFPLM
jgi:Gly-Xaa carboxypeptidase